MKALSIRQPWAWLIVNGFKDIENRTWRTRFQGRILVHASKGMTKGEYESAQRIAKQQGIDLPDAADLERGGIVGSVTIADCVSESDSPWFAGHYGFVLHAPRVLRFVPLNGSLGLFNTKPYAKLHDDAFRQTGRTSRQMKNSPIGAIYVWPCRDSIGYAKRLANNLGRADLRIVSPGNFHVGRVTGRTLSGVIIDHATILSPQGLEAYHAALCAVKTPLVPEGE